MRTENRYASPDPDPDGFSKPQAEAWGIAGRLRRSHETTLYYHVWFATKRRRWLLQEEIEEKVKQLLHQIARDRRIDLLACETMVDHVHLLLRSSPKDLPRAVFFLKGTSARRVFQAFPELKEDAETQSFWQARYGAKIVPEKALPLVKKYIATQKERAGKYKP